MGSSEIQCMDYSHCCYNARRRLCSAYDPCETPEEGEAPPHRDARNAAFPTLIVNLSEGHPGGTWIEDPRGSISMACSEGLTRQGRIITGRRYRISARQLRHSSVKAAQDRLLLLGYVPAGWSHSTQEDRCALQCLNFCAPIQHAEARSAMTLWRGVSSSTQTSLEAFGVRSSRALGGDRQWEDGRLKHMCGELHICLSSDESDDTDDDVLVCNT